MIGYQWPNVSRRVVTCINPKMSVLPVFLLMCTPDCIHPSPQDLRELKLSRFRNFRYFKKKEWTKPIYFDIDLQRQLLDSTGHPQRADLPFRNIPLFIYLFFALPPAIQFHLPSTSFVNTCVTVITCRTCLANISYSTSLLTSVVHRNRHTSCVIMNL